MNELKNIIIEKVTRYKDKMDTYYSKMDDNEINMIEQNYNVKLPDSYKWFQKEFIFGGMAIDILGKVVHSETNKVTNLLIERNDDYIERGLPKGLIVICHVDEYGYFLDTNRMDANNECPVVSWTNYDNAGIIHLKNNFYEFLLDQINNSIENNFFED